MLEQHYDLAAVAIRLAVSTDQVSLLISRGELAAVDMALRPGGRRCWRVPESAIAEFIERRKAAPPMPEVRRTRRPRLTGIPRVFR